MYTVYSVIYFADKGRHAQESGAKSGSFVVFTLSNRCIQHQIDLNFHIDFS